VSRIAKRAGTRGILLALPLVAVGAYALVAVGAGVALFRWAKTAENAVDYSFMSTAKHVVWLPASRDEKFKAKQVVDTLFVRAGDVVAAGAIVAGARLGVTTSCFGMLNVALAAVGAFTALSAASSYDRLVGRARLELAREPRPH
jgi:ATP:ADP antiporter, AAA family